MDLAGHQALEDSLSRRVWGWFWTGPGCAQPGLLTLSPLCQRPTGPAKMKPWEPDNEVEC